MSTMTITYLDVPLTVDYEFEAGERATFDYPGSADWADINSVSVNGADITNLIDQDTLERIAEIVANDHVDSQGWEISERFAKEVLA